MKNKLLSHLASQLGTIHSYQPLSGGDISAVYLIQTKHDSFVVKTGDVSQISMFIAEKEGLEAIKNSKTIAVPQVILVGKTVEVAYLVMEYIPTKQANEKDMKLLGQQLAQMHQVEASDFGFHNSNFIGSLPQPNTQHPSWNRFYVEERLSPQIQMAQKRGLLLPAECPSKEAFLLGLQDYMQDIKPVLLHGDLWSGNYLIHENGTPYVIDPAVYYGHRLVDIAMSRLFGGFSNAFYKTYYKSFKAVENEPALLDIYQLYYLLVHLNLFGMHYKHAVLSKLKKYF